MAKLEKAYNSIHVEDKWYSHWMDKKYFSADPSSEKEPYTIVIPPPNVTGMLTVGHVLNNTIQDILNMIKKLPGSPKIRKNKPTTPILIGGTNTAGCIADTRPYSAVNLAKEGYYTQILLPMCADYQVKGVTTADKHMQAFSSLYNRIKFNNEAIKYIDIGMEPKI